LSAYKYILTETNNNTGIIKINRPEVYNALNVEAKLEIIKAIRAFNKDTSIRSIVLTGEGKAFCSGQDLNDRTVNSDHGPVDIGNTLINEWNPLISAIRESEKIIIAAINGVCAGAGLSVVMSCDLKITIPKNRFISGFTQIGLVPDAGMDHVLVNAMGYSKALEFALLGKPISSEEALSYGLVNEIAENYFERATELSQTINELAPLSVKSVKKNLQYAQDHSFDEVLNREVYTQRYLGFSQDYKEGVKAFLEKRKPQFKGE
jgi:2-(1,2-epoxy-1,2-dihydrophenyl)acetyl-CoA isomerase